MHCVDSWAVRRLALFVTAAVALTPCLAAADSVADLQALCAPGSAGGHTITLAEAQAFAAAADAYDADDAVRGIVFARVIRPSCADGVYSTLITALRYRVAGLAVSQNQAPGMRFARQPGATAISATFDARGCSYTRVDVVYTWDYWATTGAATLVEQQPGLFQATLVGAPAEGTFDYALHLFGADGCDLWLNNGRDLGVYQGQLHYNHRLALGAMAATPTTPTRPALCQLVRSFADPDSPGGAKVVSAETNLLVEETTWEGGSAINDPAVLNPAINEVSLMQQEGVVFEAGVAETMTQFISNLRWESASWPDALFSRSAGGQLQLWTSVPDAAAMKVVFSTDGWNTPLVAQCSADAPCALGHLPPGTHLAYAVDLQLADGSTRRIRAMNAAGVEKNFFQPVP
jgi:hypothetical protein